MGLAFLIGFCLVALDMYGNVNVNKGNGTYNVDQFGDSFQKRPNEKDFETTGKTLAGCKKKKKHLSESDNRDVAKYAIEECTKKIK